MRQQDFTKRCRNRDILQQNLLLARRGRLTAVGLVLAVLTVVVLVARPTHRDAAAAGAGEVVQGTLQLPLV